jgi:hypothetical protein
VAIVAAPQRAGTRARATAPLGVPPILLAVRARLAPAETGRRPRGFRQVLVTTWARLYRLRPRMTAFRNLLTHVRPPIPRLLPLIFRPLPLKLVVSCFDVGGIRPPRTRLTS